MVIVNGVAAKEMWDSFRKGRSDTGPTVTLKYLIEAQALQGSPPGTAALGPEVLGDLFVDGVMGGVNITGKVGTAGAWIYTPRMVCPTNTRLYATEAWADYLGENGRGGGNPQFHACVVTVTYGVLSWDQLQSDDPNGYNSFPNDDNPGQPYISATQEMDFADEFIPIPGGSMAFVSDKKPLDAPAGKWVANCTIRFGRKNVPYLPFTQMLPLLNKINQQTFFGQGRGQVRFHALRTMRHYMSDGERVQDLDLIFMWREYDWNYYLRPDKLVFEKVVDPAGNFPYTYADLRPLLTI